MIGQARQGALLSRLARNATPDRPVRRWGCSWPSAPARRILDQAFSLVVVACQAQSKVRPNQVSAWKRQAVDGLGSVFSNGADKARMDHEDEVHDLHAKIGQLTVERDFLAKGLKR